MSRAKQETPNPLDPKGYHELLKHVMTFLGPRELARLEEINNDWRHIASSDEVWLKATGATKENHKPTLYTLISIPVRSLKMSYHNNFKIDEKIVQNFFLDTNTRKQVDWPEGFGTNYVWNFDGKREYVNKNRIFKNEQEMMDLFSKAVDESPEYSDYLQDACFIKYQQRGNMIQLLGIKYIFSDEFIDINCPVIFDRASIKNFPSFNPLDSTLSADNGEKAMSVEKEAITVATSTEENKDNKNPTITGNNTRQEQKNASIANNTPQAQNRHIFHNNPHRGRGNSRAPIELPPGYKGTSSCTIS
ncbi:F-box protein [Legionella spiritensis]|uniref:F-box domain-containing protein n=1 Tax=Legionella spiritensis TaxID=452 RepID=A0A0W0Z8M4_LEGSP|nr:hypothetical protein [Legionella spiritensis]KTD65452.1 hypothetical protein Lspi_0526 [Legionella spiritensis]SNV35726.1 Uncharacterised protein [Legionella spiritensis]